MRRGLRHEGVESRHDAALRRQPQRQQVVHRVVGHRPEQVELPATRRVRRLRLDPPDAGSGPPDRAPRDHQACRRQDQHPNLPHAADRCARPVDQLGRREEAGAVLGHPVRLDAVGEVEQPAADGDGAEEPQQRASPAVSVTPRRRLFAPHSSPVPEVLEVELTRRAAGDLVGRTIVAVERTDPLVVDEGVDAEVPGRRSSASTGSASCCCCAPTGRSSGCTSG